MKKEKYIGLRVTEDSYVEIKSFCENYGISVSDFLRLTLDGELEKYGRYKGLTKDEIVEYVKKTNELIEAVGKVQWEVNKIGVNVNQIAKSFHLNDGDKEDIEDLMKGLDRIESLIKGVNDSVWHLLA